MSRRAERKKQGETLNVLRRLYPIACVMSSLAVILLMPGDSQKAYAAAVFAMCSVVVCGAVLARSVGKYEKQEAGYGRADEVDPFAGYEKPMTGQLKPLIRRVKNCLRWDQRGQ